ncbi:DUF4355 domain-containing protein [Bacillaceae bacterium SIJ1]|uniref:capsid assembly scaffolding protein Gp46 family protein n=1 Tax=Litoribacterium kuwaitense TaxID=1398745 RepID=UPI0013E9FC9A|nr:DUF4355 domain-containing protein [Litoribacterium kuwaitense]NGP45977.1 DUF4355 domain-containing protein [Litoribacterium kuwaitense]
MKSNTFERLLKLNLQYFAEEGEEEDSQDQTDTPDEGEEKTFTQEDMDNAIQQRLAKEKKKFEQERKKQEKEMREQIEQEKKEAAELAKLSEEERLKVEAEKKEMQLKQREEELNEKEKEFQRKKLEMDTVEVLRERKLPPQFASLVLGEDSEDTLNNIVTFQEEWQEAIEAEVNKRLATDTPSVGTKNKGTYNPWKKETRNLTEQGRILRENPELAQKLKTQAGVK